MSIGLDNGMAFVTATPIQREKNNERFFFNHNSTPWYHGIKLGIAADAHKPGKWKIEVFF